MIIDLNNSITYEYDQDIIIPKKYYENSDVVSINNLHIKGIINNELVDETKVKMNIIGNLVLLDSISLEEVSYPFTIDYDDFLEENSTNDKNLLDLFQFLWENIVLEIPLKFTKVSDLSRFHGNGWKLISEDELISNNNPFNDLLNNFDKKE